MGQCLRPGELIFVSAISGCCAAQSHTSVCLYCGPPCTTRFYKTTARSKVLKLGGRLDAIIQDVFLTNLVRVDGANMPWLVFLPLDGVDSVTPVTTLFYYLFECGSPMGRRLRTW
jgi:hypothetical protein